MDPAVTTGQVRVAVVNDNAVADLALPVSLPIRELIPRIRATLASGRDDDDDALPAPTHDDNFGLRPHSLAPIGGTPFSLDATLDALGVEEGEQLVLVQVPPGPAAPPVVEDLADAAAIHAAARFKPLSRDSMRIVVQVAGLAVAALLCGLALYGWSTGREQWARITLAAVTAVFIAVTTIAGRHGHSHLSGRIGVATTIPLALTVAVALPAGTPVATRLFAAAAFCVAWSLLLSVLTRTWVATNTALIAVGASVAAAAAVRTVWALPNPTLGCGLLIVSLVMAWWAPTAAVGLSKYPLFNVPAPGEPTPDALTLPQLERLPRQAELTQAFQSGLVAASVIVAVIGAVLTVWLPAQPSWLAWWLVVATVAVTVLRMRIWEASVCALWLMATPLLAAAALTVSFFVTGHLFAGVVAAAILVALLAVVALAAMVTPPQLNTPQLRFLDLFENALLITILPAAVWLVGIVSLIRNRGAL